MQTYTLDRSGASPLYEQLYRALKADILSGALPGGSRLPSGRALPRLVLKITLPPMPISRPRL